MGGESRENWASALAPSSKRTGLLSADDEVYDHGKDDRIVDEREDCVSENHPAIRRVGYPHIRNGQAHSDGEGGVGEVELAWLLIAGNARPLEDSSDR